MELAGQALANNERRGNDDVDRRAGKSDGQALANGKTWLIATPAFQTETGITPNITSHNFLLASFEG